jgi:hypothetical protein
MTTPGSSQIILQAVQNSFVRLNVGDAGPTALKKVVDEFQDFIKSRYPEGRISCVQDGEHGVVRNDMSMNPMIEQRVPGAYVRDFPVQQSYLSDISEGLKHSTTADPRQTLLCPWSRYRNDKSSS